MKVMYFSWKQSNMYPYRFQVKKHIESNVNWWFDRYYKTLSDKMIIKYLTEYDWYDNTHFFVTYDQLNAWTYKQYFIYTLKDNDLFTPEIELATKL